MQASYDRAVSVDGLCFGRRETPPTSSIVLRYVEGGFCNTVGGLHQLRAAGRLSGRSRFGGALPGVDPARYRGRRGD